jgi:hypothetical protein
MPARASTRTSITRWSGSLVLGPFPQPVIITGTIADITVHNNTVRIFLDMVNPPIR